MAKKIRTTAGTKEKVNGYEVTDLINNGALALSYAAKSPKGEKVFFKQYKSPTVTVDWYRGYVEYQQELKRRIEANAVKRFTYRFIDFFEANYGHLCYFQVFEFVEEGHDLEQILDKIRKNPASFSWEQRLIFSKVFMASVNALHLAKIVHCDLKPPNIQLFKDESIDAGYVVKLIDMDYSILTDRRAPWHGHQGYVGSPAYFSPEHLTPGGIPLTASDVFTCGLILYELLGQGHPYRFDDPEKYQKAALSHGAARVKLIGKMPAPANDADVAEAIWRCLAPDPAQRPSAQDVLAVLNGVRPLGPIPPPSDASAGSRPVEPPPKPHAPELVPPTVGPEATVEPPTSTIGTELALVAESGKDVRMRIRTPVGKYMLLTLGDDAKYYDSSEQFILERATDGQWLVKPNPTAKNQTLLNGKAIADAQPIKNGDTLAAGNEQRAVQKLPLTVRIS